MSLFGSEEIEASNVTASPAIGAVGANVNAATGGYGALKCSRKTDVPALP